jgi:hypothetical protein
VEEKEFELSVPRRRSFPAQDHPAWCKVLITGFATRTAASLVLRGWVRSPSHGSVEALVMGARAGRFGD